MPSSKTQKKKNTGTNGGIIAVCIVGGLLIIGIIAAILALVIGNFADSTDIEHPANVNMMAVQNEINALQTGDFIDTDTPTDYVKIKVKDHGDIIVRLREDIAPITVRNFRKLVNESFYDGLTFHRVVQNFMIQGGDPKGNGSGGSNPIKGEFSANGWDNQLSHIKGVISMARRGNDMNSGSCQFFICTSSDYAESSLDGMYASFGYVVAGMDTVMSIAKVDVAYNSQGTEKSVPIDDVIIEKVSFVSPIR